jgi:hippurate hydrolase
MRTFIVVLIVVLLPGAALAHAVSDAEIEAALPDAKTLFLDLHQHPELSRHETRTAALLASKLRLLGYDVTEHVGGTGIVALMKNGAGPTVMLRTELDALPVEEKTGLPYASKAHAKNDAGVDVPVAHACGHDLHMSSLYATAAVMAHTKDKWHGTLMLIGQPAEETVTGAKAMIADGLFTRFPKPDYAVGLHVFETSAPAGKVGLGAGYYYANADTVDITVFGKGAHGSRPESSIDPVLIASRIVVTLQEIVSRELAPGTRAVVTVGQIHGGTKDNIIPDTATLGLTVRSYEPETRKHLLASIERIAKAEAEAAGAEQMPEIAHPESTDALYNDPRLAARMRPVLESALGKDNVMDTPPIMGSEDFSVYGEQGVPSLFITLGGADPAKWAVAHGNDLPSNHSSLFQVDLDPALRTGVTAEVAMLRDLLK